MSRAQAISSIGMRVADLPAAHRFFAWAIRTWAAHHVDVREAWAILERAFAAERIPAALDPFDRMMGAIFGALARWPDIRCVRCPHIGSEEASLIESLAALQNGKPLVARNALKRWVLSPALKRVCEAGTECMTHAAASGVCLIDGKPAVAATDGCRNSTSQHGSASRSLASQSTLCSLRRPPALAERARTSESVSWE